MKIFAAKIEDIHQGWVWLKDDTLQPRSIIQIKNPQLGKVVYCEALQIDNNYINGYNASADRLNIKDPENVIVMGDWFRQGLGGLATNTNTPLER